MKDKTRFALTVAGLLIGGSLAWWLHARYTPAPDAPTSPAVTLPLRKAPPEDPIHQLTSRPASGPASQPNSRKAHP